MGGTLPRLSLYVEKMKPHNEPVPERDENQEAVRQVEKATESEPVRGEELLASEEWKRQLREAKRGQSNAASAPDAS